MMTVDWVDVFFELVDAEVSEEDGRVGASTAATA
jgi:hypothetical protein